MLSGSEIGHMLARSSLEDLYSVSLRTFELAAALHDLQQHQEKMEAIFAAIDLVRPHTSVECK